MERSGTDGDTGDFASSETMDASDDSRAPVSNATRIPAVATSNDTDYTGLISVDPKHYVVGDELARGGMGRIVRAHDRRLGRDVAIKELLPRHDDLRFEREARITARLAHPAIVAIHEAGRWPNGAPFFAMKLVAGTSFDKVILAATTFAERLALVGNVITAVDALAYAHSERVIHRDLKPANVLVGKYGETVVIDWGLAKDLDTVDETVDVDDPDYEPKEGETVIGAVMGTPSYMSPEQADGARVDARTDVYALGALLYHVLAGSPPYEGKSTAEVLERVLQEPPPPLAARAPDAPLELIAIVERAMTRDLAKRFQNAGEMAEELDRFQTGQLIKSHRYTARELFRRWVRRNRAPIAVGAIAFVTLAAVGIASLVKIISETHRADHEAAVASERADRGTIEHAHNLLEVDPSLALAALRELSPGSAHWREARMIVADAAQRGIARVLRSDGGQRVEQLAWSADGTHIAATVGKELMAWDLNDGVTYRLATSVEQDSIAWDGNDLVHADRDGQVSRWHALHGGDDKIAAFEDASISLSPNGRWLVATSPDQRGTLVELATKKRLELDRISMLQWDVTSTALLVADQRSYEVRRTDLATGKVETWPVAADAEIHALTAVGDIVIVSTQDKLIRLGAGSRQTGFTTPASNVALLPDGRTVTTTSNAAEDTLIGAEQLDDNIADSSIAIGDGSTAFVKLHGHRTATTALAVSLQGRIASADDKGNIRVWWRTPVAHTDNAPVVQGAFLDSARTHVVAMQHEAALRIPLGTGATTRIAQPAPHLDPGEETNGDPTTLVRSASGAEWATKDAAGRAWLWNGTRALRLCATPECLRVESITISADGTRVVTISGSQPVLWDGHTGARLPFTAPETLISAAIAIAQDGRTIAIAEHNDGPPPSDRILLYGATGAQLAELPLAHASPVTVMTFTPSGAQLAVAYGSTIHLIDLATHHDQTFEGHELEIGSIAFTPDNRMITTSSDATARIWNLADHSAKVLRGHAKRVTTVDLMGDMAVTSSLDGTARVWDLETEQSRILPDHARGSVLAGFSTTGEILTLDLDGRLSHYTDTTPWGEAALRGWIDALTNAQ